VEEHFWYEKAIQNLRYIKIPGRQKIAVARVDVRVCVRVRQKREVVSWRIAGRSIIRLRKSRSTVRNTSVGYCMGHETTLCSAFNKNI